MEATAGPYAWDPHLIAWVILAIAVVLVVAGHRRLARAAPLPTPWTPRQIRQSGHGPHPYVDTPLEARRVEIILRAP